MTKQEQPNSFFYKIGMDDSDPLAMVCVERDDRGFNEYQFYAGKLIENWPEGITFYLEGEHQEDYLASGLHWIAVSESVRQVIIKHQINGVQWLPVRVVHTKTNNEIGPYWIINIITVVPALDLKRTRWLNSQTKEKDKYPTLNIVREVFVQEELREIDIFRLSIGEEIGSSIYISERFKQLLEQEEASSGFKFTAIPAY